MIVLVGQTTLVSPLRQGAHYVLSPFQTLGSSSGRYLGRKVQFFRDILVLRQENVYLREQLHLAYSQLVYYRPLEEENRLLRQQLGAVRQEQDWTYVLAKVSGRSFGDQTTWLVLDQGSSSGVQEGSPVVYGKYLLGRVGRVFGTYCLAQLLTDPEFSVAVAGQGSGGRVLGLAHGDYGTSLTLGRILNEASLATGELVTTSGEDGRFPEGLIVGQVDEVFSRDADPLKQARLRTLLNVEEIGEVFILTSSNN